MVVAGRCTYILLGLILNIRPYDEMELLTRLRLQIVKYL